jgi:hypothetical protein
MFTLPTITMSMVIHSILTTLAISIPLRALEAAMNLRAGMDLGAAVQEAAIGVLFDVGLSLLMLGVLSFASRMVRIRSAAQSIQVLKAARPANSVWSLDPFARGRAIERMILGRAANITVSNFPVIDDYANGIATSIKSLDLTASSYSSATGLSSRLADYARRLAQFGGSTWGGVTIPPLGQTIQSRVLLVAFEQGAPTVQQAQTLRAFLQTASQQWPKIKVVFQFL